MVVFILPCKCADYFQAMRAFPKDSLVFVKDYFANIRLYFQKIQQ
jgi:hypothetical protein